MNTPTPEALAALKVGDAVVVRLNCGTEQSALVGAIAPDGRVTFRWKIGPRPEDDGGISMGGRFLAERVIAIFPPDCKFMVTQ